MTSIKAYLLSVAAASLLMGFVSAVIPEGRSKKVASFTGSLLLLLSILSPVVRLSASSLTKAAAALQAEMETLQTGVEIKNTDILAELITEQCEEYILDKAAEMGLTLEVCITIDKEADVPYPTAVSIKGICSDSEQEMIASILETDLGILRENQEWNVP